MDRKTSILAGIFFSLVIISLGAIFYRYILAKNITFYTDQEAFEEALLEE